MGQRADSRETAPSTKMRPEYQEWRRGVGLIGNDIEKRPWATADLLWAITEPKPAQISTPVLEIYLDLSDARRAIVGHLDASGEAQVLDGGIGRDSLLQRAGPRAQDASLGEGRSV